MGIISSMLPIALEYKLKEKAIQDRLNAQVSLSDAERRNQMAMLKARTDAAMFSTGGAIPEWAGGRIVGSEGMGNIYGQEVMYPSGQDGTGVSSPFWSMFAREAQQERGQDVRSQRAYEADMARTEALNNQTLARLAIERAGASGAGVPGATPTAQTIETLRGSELWNNAYTEQFEAYLDQEDEFGAPVYSPEEAATLARQEADKQVQYIYGLPQGGGYEGVQEGALPEVGEGQQEAEQKTGQATGSVASLLNPAREVSPEAQREEAQFLLGKIRKENPGASEQEVQQKLLARIQAGRMLAQQAEAEGGGPGFTDNPIVRTILDTYGDAQNLASNTANLLAVETPSMLQRAWNAGGFTPEATRDFEEAASDVLGVFSGEPSKSTINKRIGQFYGDTAYEPLMNLVEGMAFDPLTLWGAGPATKTVIGAGGTSAQTGRMGALGGRAASRIGQVLSRTPAVKGPGVLRRVSRYVGGIPSRVAGRYTPGAPERALGSLYSKAAERVGKIASGFGRTRPLDTSGVRLGANVGRVSPSQVEGLLYGGTNLSDDAIIRMFARGADQGRLVGSNPQSSSGLKWASRALRRWAM